MGLVNCLNPYAALDATLHVLRTCCCICYLPRAHVPKQSGPESTGFQGHPRLALIGRSRVKLAASGPHTWRTECLTLHWLFSRSPNARLFLSGPDKIDVAFLLTQQPRCLLFGAQSECLQVQSSHAAPAVSRCCSLRPAQDNAPRTCA